MVEGRHVERHAAGGLLQVGAGADPSEAQFRTEGDEPAEGGGLQSLDRRFTAVGDGEPGGGEERRLDGGVAAGPGRGGVGVAERGQASAKGGKEGWGEVGFGSGRLEQDGRARGQRRQQGLEEQAGGFGRQDDQAEAVFALAVWLA